MVGGGGGGKGPSEEEQAASETSFKWSRRWGVVWVQVCTGVCVYNLMLANTQLLGQLCMPFGG